MDDESRDAAALQKRWTGGELLLCVAIQLVLVNVAYRIDRRQQAPLLSTSAWAIFFGLVVRSQPPCPAMEPPWSREASVPVSWH